jgi:deoxyribodipyrimidine photolyase
MLKALGEENEHDGGFNEFAQFCEESLADLAEHLTEEGQQLLIENIERTSCLGVTRRSPSVKPGKRRRIYAQ